MNDKQELTKYLHLIIKIGSGVVSAILAGFLIGLMLDRHFELNGVPIFIGVIVGVILGFIWIYREVMKIDSIETD